MTALKVGSLFTGYGGLDQAVEDVFGAETVWTSDIDPGASKIIAHRYPGVPNLGDLTAVDWTAVEPVDIVTGGFPCQDVSHAGKRAGLHPDTRSGLWSHMAYAVSVLRPKYVIAENVRGLLSAEAASDVESCPWCLGGAGHGGSPLRALGAVLGDLAELGYDARWIGLRAADVGAPHGRFRVFVVAVAQDADRSARGERWESAPGPAEGRGTRADARGRDRAPSPDPLGRGLDGRSPEPFGGPLVGAPPAGGGEANRASADAVRNGCDERSRLPEVLGSAPRSDAQQGDQRERDRDAARDSRPADVQWGPYEPAVRRWERLSGRVAPTPTELAPKGGQRLSPRFVEWMMGLPAGWVTDVPGLNRNAQLKALGNGVVPQQAAAGIRLALTP